MNNNQQLIENFYAAFQKRDGKSMTDCYHPEAQFSDAVFTDLRGQDVGRMWRIGHSNHESAPRVFKQAS